jgi:hypothetical protein
MNRPCDESTLRWIDSRWIDLAMNRLGDKTTRDKSTHDESYCDESYQTRIFGFHSTGVPIWLENNSKSWKIDFFGKVFLDLFLLLLFCFSCILYSTSPFSCENFDPCNFSQGVKKVVFYKIFHAMEYLKIDFLWIYKS